MLEVSIRFLLAESEDIKGLVGCLVPGDRGIFCLETGFLGALLASSIQKTETCQGLLAVSRRPVSGFPARLARYTYNLSSADPKCLLGPVTSILKTHGKKPQGRFFLPRHRPLPPRDYLMAK